MHINILSGTPGGGIAPRVLDLSRHTNVNQIGGLMLEYVVTEHIDLQRVANVTTFGTLTLETVVVTNMPINSPVTNVNTINPLTLSNLPFVPANPETSVLISVLDGSYTTTEKIQMDRLITELKSAGVWAKLDWYGIAYWAKTEHDALLNWIDPVHKTLTKVGSASWAQGVGLSGVNPVTSNSRYKSGWNVGDGANSTATNISMFSKVTAIAVPQNGLQPMGVWRLISGGGPVTPDGMFIQLSVLAGTGFAGANLQNGNGNSSFNPGDGIGVWGISHNGTSQITVKDGATLETDTVSGSSSYTDADGMSVAGSAGTAKKSFPGTQMYWGWGGALTNTEFAAIESAFQTAILPPTPSDNITDGVIVDGDNDYLLIDTDLYLIVDGPP